MKNDGKHRLQYTGNEYSTTGMNVYLDPSRALSSV